MNFSVDRVEDAVILEVKGDLWGGFEVYQLKEEVSSWLRRGERRFLLDLTGRHLNSAGIGILVAILSGVRQAGGELRLCAVGERARRALAVAGVVRLFAIHEDRETALHAWGIGVAA
jgi:anti-sigma B factor antagonist